MLARSLLVALLARAAAVPALLKREKGSISDAELAPFLDQAEQIADALREQIDAESAAKLEKHKWDAESAAARHTDDGAPEKRVPYSMRLRYMVRKQLGHRWDARNNRWDTENPAMKANAARALRFPMPLSPRTTSLKLPERAGTGPGRPGRPRQDDPFRSERTAGRE